MATMGKTRRTDARELRTYYSGSRMVTIESDKMAHTVEIAERMSTGNYTHALAVFKTRDEARAFYAQQITQ